MTDIDCGNFLIDNKVLFSPSEDSLSHCENGVLKKLKLTETRCLLFLLENHGSVVTQSSLMTYIWGEKQYQINFNTFYQCILALRKAFIQLGLSGKIITTVPRQGVMISKEVLVELVNLTQKEGGGDESILHNKKIVSSQGENIFFFKSSLFKWLILLIVMTVSVFFWILFQPHNDVFFTRYQIIPPKNDLCRYYVNIDATNYNRHELLLRQHPELCQLNSFLYITTYSNTKNVSAISCTAPIGGSVNNHCQSFYYPELQGK